MTGHARQLFDESVQEPLILAGPGDAGARLGDPKDRVRTGPGDRATLELMLDSLTSGVLGEPLEVSRKLAFRGNSGIWGLQAKVRLRAVFVAPNSERPDMIDLAPISGLVHLRRFRADAVWPLFIRKRFNDDGTPLTGSDEAIDPDFDGRNGSKLIADFCTQPLPKFRVIPVHLGERYELAGGPVGNRGAQTCIYGSFHRLFAPRYRDEANEYGEFHATVNAPSEYLVFDVIVHKDLAVDMKLETQVLHSDHPGPSSGRSGGVVPCPEQLQHLGSGPPQMATPHLSRYRELIQRVYDRMGWDPKDFTAWRYEMKQPPTPATVTLRYALPERP